MKRILFLLLLFTPVGLFAQKDSLLVIENDNPVVEYLDEHPSETYTWKDRREPILAGFLSYVMPGLGQVYNKEYEKAFGVLTVMLFSGYLTSQAVETGKMGRSFISAAGMSATYLFSIIDAVVVAKKINRAIAVQMGKDVSMSIKPDIQWSNTPSNVGFSRQNPTFGLRLNVSL